MFASIEADYLKKYYTVSRGFANHHNVLEYLGGVYGTFCSTHSRPWITMKSINTKAFRDLSSHAQIGVLRIHYDEGKKLCEGDCSLCTVCRFCRSYPSSMSSILHLLYSDIIKDNSNFNLHIYFSLFQGLWPKIDDDDPSSGLVEPETFEKAARFIRGLYPPFPTFDSRDPSPYEDATNLKNEELPLECLPDCWKFNRDQDKVANDEDKRAAAKGSHLHILYHNSTHPHFLIYLSCLAFNRSGVLDLEAKTSKAENSDDGEEEDSEDAFNNGSESGKKTLAVLADTQETQPLDGEVVQKTPPSSGTNPGSPKPLSSEPGPATPQSKTAGSESTPSHKTRGIFLAFLSLAFFLA